MKIVSVIPLKKGLQKGDLTYFTSLDIPPGHIVSVPLRKKEVLALVTSSADLEEAKADVKGMNFDLRKVSEDKGPSIFSKEFLGAAIDVSRYSAAEKSLGISSLVPNLMLEEYEAISRIYRSSAQNAPLENHNLRPEKLAFQYPFSDRVSIYKTLIREAFARKKSVFLVLPTESDIEKWSIELGRGIEQFTFKLYGGQSAKKSLKIYEEIFSSDHPVLMLGTAPFLALPHKDISTIILEHESSTAYRTLKRPYIDLRIFVETYASKLGTKLIVADDLLRFETIGKIDDDLLHPLYPLSYRMDFSGIIEVLRRTKHTNSAWKIFTESIEDIRTAVTGKKNVFVFSLRKGLATETVCRDCGDTLNCRDCTAPLVLYTTELGKKRVFVCNRCERNWGADMLCRGCGSWNLMPLGIGTDTVYEELKSRLPKTKIFKLDKESVRNAAGAKKIVREWEEEKGSVLVGTEMAFFYLSNKAPLSVIASFDSLWSIPNYKMSEKILQIILRLASVTSDKIIIETKNPDDTAIRSICSGNLLQFIRSELEDRRKLGYPPWARFIKITFYGNKEETAGAKKSLADIFASYEPHIFSGFIARQKGKYVTNALIRLDPARWSLKELSNGSIDGNLLQRLLNLPPAYEVHVDPEDLL